MQQLNFQGQNYVEEAVEWLRSNCGDKHVLVCFSGGKDSIVTEALCRMSKISYSLNSTLTGIDPPQVTQFIRKNYPQCSFVRPKQTFWHMLTTHNPPGGSGQGIKWCCTKIKEMPSAKIPIKHRVLGIRAEESGPRSKYGRVNQVKNETHYHPILYWKEWQVWEFIQQNRLVFPSLYQRLDRIGCVICPNHANHHEVYRELWPRHFECFERYTRIWWDKRLNQGKEMWYESPDVFLKHWYAGEFYYYKPTGTEEASDEHH